MPKYSRSVVVPGKTSQELYDRLSVDIDKFLAKVSIGRIDVDRDAGLKQVLVRSSMLKVTLTCEDGQIRVDGDLSFIAAPFRSKIDDGIDRWVARTFASNGGGGPPPAAA